MIPNIDRREWLSIGGALALAVVLFLFDLLTPRGVADTVLYIGVVLIALTSRHPRFPVIVAGICSLFNLTGWYFSPSLPGVPFWLPTSNRLLVLFAIWAPVVFFWQRRRAEQALRQAYGELEERVRERTIELAEVNKALVAEITERMETERSLRSSEASLESSQRDVQRSREELRALAGQLLTAQDEERRRISRELHDDINQRLAMVAVDMRTMEKRTLLLPEAIRSGLHSILDRIVALSDDIRHLAYRFHPSILDDLGLVTALQGLVDDFTTRFGIKTVYVHQDLAHPLPPEIASCLYRVTQEGLANIAKHARASLVELEFTTENEDITLSLRDNGVGFDLRTHEKSRVGLGMINMKERLRLVQGTCEIHSTPHDGTQILVRVPLPVQQSWVSQKSS